MVRRSVRTAVTMADRLADRWVHLDPKGSAEAQPAFAGDMAWYAEYAARHPEPGGRLVSQFRFTEDWTSWEMHPHGAEVVICTDGEMTLVQETAEGMRETVLSGGDYAINEPGVWHTANVAQAATAIFITAGEGTEHRAR